jgi:nucleotide-binding universal stress UspA family protein
VQHTSSLPPRVLRTLPCDVAVVNGALPSPLRRILLPIRGGPYAKLALRVALALAESQKAEITVLHATMTARRGDEPSQQFLRHLRQLPQVTRWEIAQGDPVQAIAASLRGDAHQLVVMGAVAAPRRDDSPIGPTAKTILDEDYTPALVVKSRRAFPMPTGDQEPLDHTISVVVDKWFAENTFHAHEFEDVARLVELKERQGLTISLGLPALNEEKTIGAIIRTIRSRFMENVPLLDEIVVIDSNSTDRTCQIAQDLGVPVYRHPEILPAYGSYVGKGEALWKSLYVLKGDIIAWIDTDILDLHPRFVYGILGPLIKEPQLQYAKGYYQRPLRLGGRRQARGGGRVTELVARPLLNLFYPELSGFVQPLAGEYAGRRAALECVPFFTGYGVETGLLIDLLETCSLRALGQVDLEERVHRNQSLLALSQMAFAIIQVLMQRVGERYHLALMEAMQTSMKLIRYSEEEFRLEIAEIRDRVRPPIETLPEYRLAFPRMAAP